MKVLDSESLASLNDQITDAMQKQAAMALAELIRERNPLRVVFLVSDGLKGTIGRQCCQYLHQQGILTELLREGDEFPSQEADVIVDALETADEGLLRAANGALGHRLSIMIPCGIGIDNGAIRGEVFEAAETVCFDYPLSGLYLYPGSDHRGRITVLEGPFKETDIESHLAVNSLTEVISRLPVRRKHSHKGTYGKVLLIAGSPGKSGACKLCGQAILRSGAGLLTVMVPRDILLTVENGLWEAMTVSYGDDWKQAADDIDFSQYTTVVLGCGLGRDQRSEYLMIKALESPCDLLLDADGLYHLGKHLDLLKREALTVITPHEVEYQRVFPLKRETLLKDLEEITRRYPSLIIVLKGEHTITASRHLITFNTTGNDALAKGGSGDVLAGLIGGLIAQKPDYDSVTAGVYLHSLAADRWIEKHSRYSLTARDIIREYDDIIVEEAGGH